MERMHPNHANETQQIRPANILKDPGFLLIFFYFFIIILTLLMGCTLSGHAGALAAPQQSVTDSGRPADQVPPRPKPEIPNLSQSALANSLPRVFEVVR